MIDRYLNTAYRPGSRGEVRRGLVYHDCWSLVQTVREELFGIPRMTDYGDLTAANPRGITRAVKREIQWLQEVAPQDGAIAIVWEGGISTHVGVCVALDGRMGVLDTHEDHGPRWQTVAIFQKRSGNVRYFI